MLWKGNVRWLRGQPRARRMQRTKDALRRNRPRFQRRQKGRAVEALRRRHARRDGPVAAAFRSSSVCSGRGWARRTVVPCGPGRGKSPPRSIHDSPMMRRGRSRRPATTPPPARPRPPRSPARPPAGSPACRDASRRGGRAKDGGSRFFVGKNGSWRQRFTAKNGG